MDGYSSLETNGVGFHNEGHTSAPLFLFIYSFACTTPSGRHPTRTTAAYKHHTQGKDHKKQPSMTQTTRTVTCNQTTQNTHKRQSQKARTRTRTLTCTSNESIPYSYTGDVPSRAHPLNKHGPPRVSIDSGRTLNPKQQPPLKAAAGC